MVVSDAQAQNRNTNGSGQPNTVAPANSQSSGGLNRTSPRENNPTSRSLRRASLGMMLQPVLMSPHPSGHIRCSDELAEMSNAQLPAAIQQA